MSESRTAFLRTAFPSDFVSDEEKKDKNYGKEIGQAIENQWFNGRLSFRRYWIDKMRSYSRGEQTTNYQKTIEGERGERKLDTKTHKIDYTEKLKILPVFKDISINAIDESLFKPKAEAIDVTAINNKKEYFKRLEEEFYTQDLAKVIGNGIGVDILPQDTPKDERGLQIKKLEYKPKIEIAQELAIESVMKAENFEKIKDKVDEDLFDLGIGVCKDYTDFTEGIKLKYVDPYNYIHSSFEIDDGRDIRYHGELKKDSIGELIKIAGGITEEDLLAIKKYSIGRSYSDDAYNEDEDSGRLVEYIAFEYPIYENRIFKKLRKNKTVKLIDRTKDGYNPQNENKKINIPYKVWYEGIYVPEAQVILRWQPVANQIVDNLNQPISSFKVYAPKVKRVSEKGYVRFDSMVQRAVPLIDDIHRDWYKFQQLKMELRPNTTEIDIDSINDVVLNGQKIAAEDILDLFFGRGILLKKTLDDDGEVLPRAIQENGGGVNNSAITLLSNEFSNNYNRLRQLLGINEVRDGTTQPNSKTAVTVQKLLLASSNNATNHIVKASFSLSLEMAKSISHRLYDVFTTKALKDRYMDMIGNENVELLDEIKKYPMAKYAIYFDFKPDNEERIAFEQSLVNSYSQKEINSAQYNMARQIRNVKSAIKYLEFVINENMEIAEQNKLRNIQAQAEAQARTSVLTEQTKQQTATITFETEKNLKLIDADIQDKQMRNKALIQEALNQREHLRKLEIAELEGSLQRDKINIIEDKKSERINQQSSNQSRLNVERKKEQPEAVNFENQLDRILGSGSLLPNQ